MAFDPSKAVPVSGNGQSTPTRSGFNPGKAVPVRAYVENNQAPVEQKQGSIDFSKPYQEEPSTGVGSAILQAPVGAAETALSLGSSALAPVAGTAAALASTVRNAGRAVSNLFGGNNQYEDSGAAYVQARNAATYEPRSESGKAATGLVSKAFENTVGVPLNAIGEVLTKAGMSPGAVEQTKDYLMAGVPAIAGKGIKAIRANPTIAAQVGAATEAVKAPIAAAATTAADELGMIRDAAKMAAEKTGVTAAADLVKAGAQGAVNVTSNALKKAKEHPETVGTTLGTVLGGHVGAAAGYTIGATYKAAKAAEKSAMLEKASAFNDVATAAREHDIASTHLEDTYRTASKAASEGDYGVYPQAREAANSALNDHYNQVAQYNTAVTVNRFKDREQSLKGVMSPAELQDAWNKTAAAAKITDIKYPENYMPVPEVPSGTKPYSSTSDLRVTTPSYAKNLAAENAKAAGEPFKARDAEFMAGQAEAAKATARAEAATSKTKQQAGETASAAANANFRANATVETAKMKANTFFNQIKDTAVRDAAREQFQSHVDAVNEYNKAATVNAFNDYVDAHRGSMTEAEIADKWASMAKQANMPADTIPSRVQMPAVPAGAKPMGKNSVHVATDVSIAKQMAADAELSLEKGRRAAERNANEARRTNADAERNAKVEADAAAKAKADAEAAAKTAETQAKVKEMMAAREAKAKAGSFVADTNAKTQEVRSRINVDNLGSLTTSELNSFKNTIADKALQLEIDKELARRQESPGVAPTQPKTEERASTNKPTKKASVLDKLRENLKNQPEEPMTVANRAEEIKRQDLEAQQARNRPTLGDLRAKTDGELKNLKRMTKDETLQSQIEQELKDRQENPDLRPTKSKAGERQVSAGKTTETAADLTGTRGTEYQKVKPMSDKEAMKRAEEELGKKSVGSALFEGLDQPTKAKETAAERKARKQEEEHNAATQKAFEARMKHEPEEVALEKKNVPEDMLAHLRKSPNIERSKQRTQKTGEIFTPTPLVQEMLRKLPKDQFTDASKTFLDPTSGDGQFLSEVIVRKMAHGSSYEKALETTFGADLMQDNVEAAIHRVYGAKHPVTIERLSGDKIPKNWQAPGLIAVYRVDGKKIANIVQADGLKYNYQFYEANP